jgi:hypothetical protein
MAIFWRPSPPAIPKGAHGAALKLLGNAANDLSSLSGTIGSALLRAR